ncbi:MAG: divergent polysaccharide deacetylase family protein [Holophagaceae bacterium]
MARAKGRRTSTLALVGWALLMLALGLGAGLVLGQQGCNRKEAPAKREGPRSEPKRPEKRPMEPKAKAAPQEPEPARTLPRLALVIDDLGYMQPELVTRLCSQPVPFSVAVLPYQEHTRESADIAHRLGKEVMLHLPMEPQGYPGPGRDPGPNAILYNLPESEVRRRVRMALDDIPHRTGVNNHMGSRITPDRLRMGWVLQEVKARKCFFVDSRTEKDSVAYDLAEELGVPAVQRRVFLDDDKAFPEMEKQWERALKLAEKEGAALIIGHIYPETVEALEKLVPRSKGRVRFVKAGDLVK